MEWNDFVHSVQRSSAFLALLLNLLLIILIIKKSPKQLGSYRYLMAYTSFFEIIYSIVDVIISPRMFSRKSIILVIVQTKHSIFSKFVLLLLDCVWCGFLGIFMMLFSIQFIYRYFVVVASKTLATFKDLRLILWIMLPIISGTAWGAVIYFFMGPKAQNDDYLAMLVLREIDLIYEDITYIGPRCYYQNEQGESVIDIDSIFSITYCIIVMVLSLICISYCAARTYSKIRKTLSVSDKRSNKFNRIQSQTFYALVTQAIIPVILLHFPCSYVLASAMLDIDIGHTSGIVSITIAMFPALDPLPVLLIIKNYRTTLLRLFKNPVHIFVGTRKIV